MWKNHCIPFKGLSRTRNPDGCAPFTCWAARLLQTEAEPLITENADPDVRRDLESFMTRLVPDGDPAYLHSMEGPDDMPAGSGHLAGNLPVGAPRTTTSQTDRHHGDSRPTLSAADRSEIATKCHKSSQKFTIIYLENNVLCDVVCCFS